ncbi:MAG TPA: DUF3105 domain-containing protein [Dehalococcoidia bacterium]|nr:DUF3105 domain-containing protein [Dehalococcoidia bacterium]
MHLLSNLHERLLISAIALFIVVNTVYYGGAIHIGGPITAAPAAPPSGASAPVRADLVAESDASPDLPGRFVPTQGRQHTAQYPIVHVEFCPTDQVRSDCYASNPPTSGLHLPVQPLVVLPDGHRLKIPPDPGLYAFAIPREAIPHIEEHAGVYVGYNCASAGCDRVVDEITTVVRQELSLGARVVLSPDPDLAPGTVGLAAWTRVDVFPATAYTDARVRSFIKAHSCRFDPEHFCKPPVIN